MTMEAGLKTYIGNVPGASGVSGRIYAMKLPQEPTFPAITFQRISTSHWGSQSGHSGVDDARFQIDVWSGDPDEAATIGQAVSDSLDMKKWVGMGSTVVQFSDVQNERPIFEPDPGWDRYSIDVMLTYEG